MLMHFEHSIKYYSNVSGCTNHLCLQCIACVQIPISNCIIYGSACSRKHTKCLHIFCANSASNEYIETISHSIGFHGRFVALDGAPAPPKRIVTGSWIIVAACKRFFFTLCLSLSARFTFYVFNYVFRFVLQSLPLRRDRQSELENKFVYNIQICLDNIAPGHDIMRMSCCTLYREMPSSRTW